MPLDKALIAKVFSDAQVGYEVGEVPGLGEVVRVAPRDASAALRALKGSTHAYHFLVDLFGIDTGEDVEVVYHIRSFVYDEEIDLRIRMPYGSNLESVWEVYAAALLPERECAEMFGLTLSGHPNPKRLLTIEGAPALLLKRVEIRTPEVVRDR